MAACGGQAEMRSTDPNKFVTQTQKQRPLIAATIRLLRLADEKRYETPLPPPLQSSLPSSYLLIAITMPKAKTAGNAGGVESVNKSKDRMTMME